MRGFLNNLFRDFRTAKTARPARRAPRRATPQVEGLEDRLVLTGTSAHQVGSTLFIDAAPGGPVVAQIRTITLESNGSGKLEVFDNGILLNPNHFIDMSSINAVNVTVAGGDNVTIDDSNGMPFAKGTTVTLQGSGGTLQGSGLPNLLTLTGSLAITGNEQYVAGATAFSGTKLTVTEGALFTQTTELTFKLNSAIASVKDSFRITGTLGVQTSGSNVELSGSDGLTQTLTGLGLGGGGTLTYANKGTVHLDENAAKAHVTLNATAAAAGERSLAVKLSGSFDNLRINATPSTVDTGVNASSSAFVDLKANSGPVSITGNSGTEVSVGDGTTAGIEANVSVSNVSSLTMNDGDNTTTQENVTVTESTISGTGLFGNNAAKLSYSGMKFLIIDTGQLANSFTVVGSTPGATFTSEIDILNTSDVGLSVAVTLDAGSGLHLDVQNTDLNIPSASLSISAPGGTFSSPNPVIPPGAVLSGSESVTFPGGLTSEVNFQDMTSVTTGS
jgi:hypothetical protein